MFRLICYRREAARAGLRRLAIFGCEYTRFSRATLIDRWELAGRNTQAVPAHLTVYGMRQRERVAQQLVLLGGKCENFVTRHSDR